MFFFLKKKCNYVKIELVTCTSQFSKEVGALVQIEFVVSHIYVCVCVCARARARVSECVLDKWGSMGPPFWFGTGVRC